MKSIDRQRLARNYMQAVVIAGAGVCLFSLFQLDVSRIGLPFLLLSLLAVCIASHIVIHIPQFKSNVSASDVFIFLAMLLFDGELAVLLGGLEAFCASSRIAKKRLTMMF